MSKTIKSYKGRAHRALFDDNLPFKPKVVNLKTRYQRRPKHTNKDLWG